MTAALLAFDGSRIDGGLYTDVTDAAHRAPHWLDHAILLWSDYGLALFALLMLAAWWLGRRRGPAATAQALAVPLIVVLAYSVNSVLKSLVAEDRPCRSIPRAFTLETCPGAGDWSFPSNHTVISFAAAAALLLVHRRLGAVAVLAALAMGASRVWIGVHYPHDVLAGALLGVAVAIPLTLAARRAAPLVARGRRTALAPLLGTGTG
ncbi:phosphatase PAP2 family protein [Peterkaempfera bronchialis]|uniref:Phosphatase PAP2 family protein n=1 Tax=Peterkaempfera bronchialis TaxID=2126346 RepID=A0A345T1V4_9ACTN|nr:phosphatase PAP2 family protein [Peterkaempfera bronchialis]AXI79959.1 phosphatase PAP2 family protein [Peterkaempfera bronchialis]